MPEVIWEENKAKLPILRSAYGKKRYGFKSLDFHKIGVKRGGFLEEVLAKNSFSLHQRDASYICKVLSLLATVEEIHEILETPAVRLDEADILSLASEIEKIASFSGKNQRTVFQTVWLFLRKSEIRLGDGVLISSIGYLTNLKDQKRDKKLISDFPDESIADPFLARPISAINSLDSKKQVKLAIAHLGGRLDHIKKKAAKILHCNEDLLAEIEKINDGHPPASLSNKLKQLVSKGPILPKDAFRLYDRSPEERLHLIIFFAEKYSWAHDMPGKASIEVSDHPIISKLQVGSDSSQSLFFSLAHKFASEPILMACYVFLLVETEWNASTLNTLDIDSIEKNKNHFQLTSLKGKTGQLQSDNFETIDEYNRCDAHEKIDRFPVRYCAELLIANFEKIRDLGYTGNEVFSEPTIRRQGPIKFKNINIGRALPLFCKLIGVNRFTSTQVRDQTAHLNYFKTGDINAVAAALGHENILTSLTYVDSEITRLLHLSTMRTYITALVRAIWYVSGRESTPLPDPQMEKQAKKLLFPIANYSDEDSAIGKWLASDCKDKLVIGSEEIAHCAYQKNYYKNNFSALLSADIERFKRYHLPLIIVCCALYEVILQGPHRLELLDYESKSNAD